MGKSKSLIQIYAIVVNIVAVITFLTCATNLISSLIDKADPLYSSRSAEHLSSFESYKLERMKSVDKDQVYVPTDQELMAMYEADKTNILKRIMHGINKSLMVSGLILIVSVLLFIIHWRIMKKLEVSSPDGN